MHASKRCSTSDAHLSPLSLQRSKSVERIGIVEALRSLIRSGCRASTTSGLPQSMQVSFQLYGSEQERNRLVEGISTDEC